MDAKEFMELRKLVNQILKNLNRNDLDWTVQVSISSLESRGLTYSCQIQSPSNALQPVTFIKKSYKELKEALEVAAKELNTDQVSLAYNNAEIKRSKEKLDYHKKEAKALEKKLKS